LEGNFNFLKDTDVFLRVDGETAGRYEQELKYLVVPDTTDYGPNTVIINNG
jgi:hypothetical protein